MSACLLSDLRLLPDEYGWVATVPAAFGTFQDVPIHISIHTRSNPNDAPPPCPSDTELSLASKVLGALDSVLHESIMRFSKYSDTHDPDAQHHVSNPHIWIDREFIEMGTRWAFVVERDDAPDFGYHVEFDGVTCLGIWAGD